MATASMAGYSGTPLPKKLGLKEGGTLVMLNAPEGIEKWLFPLPPASSLATKLTTATALVILFCRDTDALKKGLPTVSKKLHADGSLWAPGRRSRRNYLSISPKTASVQLCCQLDWSM